MNSRKIMLKEISERLIELEQIIQDKKIQVIDVKYLSITGEIISVS